jgi:hypothetical protein
MVLTTININIRNALIIDINIIVVFIVAIRVLKLQYVNFYIKRICHVMSTQHTRRIAQLTLRMHVELIRLR